MRSGTPRRRTSAGRQRHEHRQSTAGWRHRGRHVRAARARPEPTAASGRDTSARTGADPNDIAPGRDHARGPEVGRGLVHDPLRRHPGPVRGHDRGPRPAAPARQGHGLGHRHLRDAAARHGGALRARESARGKVGGRTHEIQRLVGRSLRGVVDLARLGERTVTVDCDVIVADGGTRTASITGGYVALAAALITYGMERHLVGHVAAVSVGIIDGMQAARPRLLGGLARRGGLQRRRARTPAPTWSSRARPRASRSTGPPWTSCWTSRTSVSGGCSRRRRRRSRRCGASGGRRDGRRCGRRPP